MNEYIEKLVKLVQYERDEEIKKMEWEIKYLTGKQREKKGRAILNLEPKVIGEELGTYLIKFGRNTIIETEINVGDEVLINKEDKIETDFKGIVVEKGSRYLVVATNKLLPKDFKVVRVDLYASDITYKRQIENLQNLSENGKKVLSYILENIQLKDEDKENFKPLDKGLNEVQKKAVSKSLSSSTFF